MLDVFGHRKVVEDEYGHQTITPIQKHGNAGRWMSHLLQGGNAGTFTPEERYYS